jgi:hypothetical protein
MVAGALLAIAGGVGVTYAFVGKPTLHLVVPAGRTIELSANGRTLTPLSSTGEHLAFELPRGTYDVAVKDKASGTERMYYALELDSGFDEYLLPIDERQCFKRLDQSRTLTTRVLARYSSQAPIKVKYTDNLDKSELPRFFKKKRTAKLLAEVDCAELGQ